MILSAKDKRNLSCRFPRLLMEGKLGSAEKLLGRFRGINDSLLLHSCRICLAESASDLEALAKLQKGTDKLLSDKGNNSGEVKDFFLRLFGYYLRQERHQKAMELLEMGREFNLSEKDFGMLWVRFCDRTGRITEGLAAMKSYLGKKKLTAKEIEALKTQYPELTEDKGFMEFISGQ